MTGKRALVVTGVALYLGVFAWCYWLLLYAAGGWND